MSITLLPHDTYLIAILIRRAYWMPTGALAVGVFGRADPTHTRRVRRSIARLRRAGYRISQSAHGYRMDDQHRSNLPEVSP